VNFSSKYSGFSLYNTNNKQNPLRPYKFWWVPTIMRTIICQQIAAISSRGVSGTGCRIFFMVLSVMFFYLKSAPRRKEHGIRVFFFKIHDTSCAFLKNTGGFLIPEKESILI
jgi:hypothetical protein